MKKINNIINLGPRTLILINLSSKKFHYRTMSVQKFLLPSHINATFQSIRLSKS
jgi:hypothetical protein